MTTATTAATEFHPFTADDRDYLETLHLGTLRKLAVERALSDMPTLRNAKKADVIALLVGEIDVTGLAGLNKAKTGAAAAAMMDMVDGMVRESIEAQLAGVDLRPTVTIQFADTSEAKVDGVAHKLMPTLLRKISAGVPALLVGPTGSGKTHLARQVAESLRRPFYFLSMSEGVTESSLLGRMMPTEGGAWQYFQSPVVKAYSEGGVLLLDEIDASDPNMLTQLNAALANGHLSVPQINRVFDRHPEFVAIAAANTYGHGADRSYVGRNALDAATLNRYQMGTIEIDYDRDLERAIVLAIVDEAELVTKLLTWAWTIREQIGACKLRRFMSTRDIENAAKLLMVGESMSEIAATYFTGWTADERNKVGG